jgi:hypothetical protein
VRAADNSGEVDANEAALRAIVRTLVELDWPTDRDTVLVWARIVVSWPSVRDRGRQPGQ